MKVYVIYKNNKLLKLSRIKGNRFYINKEDANKVVFSLSRSIAKNLYYKSKHNKIKENWYEIDENNKKIWIEKAKEQFQIKEFIENN